MILPPSLEKYEVSAIRESQFIALNPSLEFVNAYYENYVPSFTVYGYSGSTAEAYADKNEKVTFIPIDQLPTGNVTTTEPVQTTTEPEIPEKDPPQTITFKDLKPNTLYNFYDLLGDEFTADNLLYLSQGMSDQNGMLTVWYRPKADDSEAKKYVKHYETKTESNQFGAGPGDINGDNSIDVSDAVLLARFCTEDSSAIISQRGLMNADVNHSGQADSDDVLVILLYIAHMIKSFD